MKAVSRRLCWVWLLAAAPSWASVPKIVVHPLEEPQVARSELAHDRAELTLAALEAKLLIVDPVKVAPRVEALPGSSCQGKVACLASLARGFEADASLYVSVNSFAPAVKVFWWLVSADGNRIQSGNFERKKAGPHRQEWVSSALRQLFNRELTGPLSNVAVGKPVAVAVPERPVVVKVPNPSPVKPVVTAPVQTAVPLTASPTAPEIDVTRGGWIRPTAIGLGIAGATALVVGVLVGKSAVSGWDDALAKSGPAADKAALLDQRKGFDSRATLGNALEIGGAVVLAGGAALFTYDLVRPRAGTTVALGASPRAVWVEGRF